MHTHRHTQGHGDKTHKDPAEAEIHRGAGTPRDTGPQDSQRPWHRDTGGHTPARGVPTAPRPPPRARPPAAGRTHPLRPPDRAFVVRAAHKGAGSQLRASAARPPRAPMAGPAQPRAPPPGPPPPPSQWPRRAPPARSRPRRECARLGAAWSGRGARRRGAAPTRPACSG